MQETVFDTLKFSLAVGLKGHKQGELNDHVYSFPLCFSSGPHCRAEF